MLICSKVRYFILYILAEEKRKFGFCKITFGHVDELFINFDTWIPPCTEKMFFSSNSADPSPTRRCMLSAEIFSKKPVSGVLLHVNN